MKISNPLLKKGSKMPFAYYVENLRIAGGYLKSRFRQFVTCE